MQPQKYGRTDYDAAHPVLRTVSIILGRYSSILYRLI
ncbi:hypothetical protein BRC2024_ULFKEANI_CDS_0049 [Acinetobacter phage vB_AbaM_Konradin-v2]